MAERSRPPWAEQEGKPGLPGWGEGHQASDPLAEYDRGERGSFGRTYRLRTHDDDEIWDGVCRALADCEDLDASEIDVRVEHGVVYLEGAVQRPYEERLARTLAEDVPGVREVRYTLTHRDPI
jgi:hypothetical protein